MRSPQSSKHSNHGRQGAIRRGENGGNLHSATSRCLRPCPRPSAPAAQKSPPSLFPTVHQHSFIPPGNGGPPRPHPRPLHAAALPPPQGGGSGARAAPQAEFTAAGGTGSGSYMEAPPGSFAGSTLEAALEAEAPRRVGGTRGRK